MSPSNTQQLLHRYLESHLKNEYPPTSPDRPNLIKHKMIIIPNINFHNAFKSCHCIFFLADSTRRMSRQHSAIVALEKYLGLLVSCFVSYQLVQACKGPINRVNNSTPLLAPVYITWLSYLNVVIQ